MIRSLQDTIRSLQSELDRSRSRSEQYLTLITDLRSVIADLQKKLDEREKEISDLRDLNNRHNKMTFGNIWKSNKTVFTLIEISKNVGLNARDYIATTIKLLMDGNKKYDGKHPILPNG